MGRGELKMAGLFQKKLRKRNLTLFVCGISVSCRAVLLIELGDLVPDPC